MSLRRLAASCLAALVGSLLLAALVASLPLGAGLAGPGERGPAGSSPGELSACVAPDAPALFAPQGPDWRPPASRAEPGPAPVSGADRAALHPRAVDPRSGRAVPRLARWRLAHSTSTSFV